MWIPLFLCWFTVTPPTGNVERILEALAVVTDASGELGAVDIGYSAQILRNVLTSDTKLRPESVTAVVQTYDNLLQVDVAILSESQRQFNASQT